MDTEPQIVDHRLSLLRPLWRQHPTPPQAADVRPQRTPQHTVALSREAGAPGREIADEIGARLSWPVYDREIIDLIAQESGLRTELLESVDEHDRSWLIEAVASFKRRDQVSSAEFVHHLIHVLTALASHGRCVIVGRGAAACLPRATTLRVRVVADLGDRVQRIASERHISEDEAHAVIERVDRDRGRFVAGHFHRDILDAHNFDIVVNGSRLSAGVCADLTVQTLRAVQSQAAPSAADAARAKSQSPR
jgi:hypothetical protein